MNQHNDENDEIREEYDFSAGVRGKYAAAYREGTNIVLLDSDVAKVFRDSASVNGALREYIASTVHNLRVTRPANQGVQGDARRCSASLAWYNCVAARAAQR